MPSRVDNPTRWRALAAEAFAVAQQMADPESRATMVQIGFGYQHLAELAEKRMDGRAALRIRQEKGA